MVSNFPPLHPAVVHFPVALLLLAGLFGLTSLFSKREQWRNLMVKSLIGGVISSPFAVVTGFIEEQNMKHAGVDEMLMLHKYIGLAIVFFFQFLLVWYWLRKILMKNKEYKFWVICLLFGTGLVMLQGYLGGELVFTKGMGVKPVEENMGAGGHDGGSGRAEDSEMKDMPGMKKDEQKKGGKESHHDEGKQKEADGMMDMKGIDKTKGKDDMKDMKGMETDKGKDTYIINGNFYQYNMKDKENMKDMKDMDDKKGKGDMKDMKGMDDKKGEGDMKDMKGMDDKKGKDDMKDMKGMDDKKGKGDMKDMKGMDNKKGKDDMKGMNMNNPMDTFKFKDNNPARKAKKNKV